MSATPPTGKLEMTVARRGDTSIATRQRHTGALRVLRPHYPDSPRQAHYTIINPGGGYLEGDTYEIHTRVNPGAHLELRTQSATKVYRCTKLPATQQVQLHIDSHAVLSYIPEQLIMYTAAKYVQNTFLEVEPGGAGLIAEIITPGWDPAGADFQFDELQINTEIRVAGSLLAIDRLYLAPAQMEITALGVFEGYSHLGQLLLVLPHLSAQDYAAFSSAVEAMAQVKAGTSFQGNLDGNQTVCVIVRSLAHDTAAIQLLHEYVHAWFLEHIPSANS
ncbi:MAG: urease accessory protein UreD [Corynebacterium sp.]|nr:urease accessory protein UreD [Corynebacterium sp.]